MPFITEEIWQALPHDGQTIVTASWPDQAEIPNDHEAHALFESLIAAVSQARNFRAEAGVKPNERVELHVPGMLPDELQRLLESLCMATLTVTPGASSNPSDILAATTVRADPRLMRDRLERELKRLESEVERGKKKLANEAFVQKASAEAVQAERDKLTGYEADFARTKASLLEFAGD